MTIRAISRFATVLGLLAALAAEQASAMVQSRYGGRVVAVKSAGDGYNVRVLLDGGRVKTVNVAANGRMSESN
jgi:ribosomal protein L21E